MPTAESPRVDLLPGLPRKPLTPEQQLTALRRTQAQAEERVRLGVRLFNAADARLGEHRALLDGVRAEQEQLRAELREEVTRSLRQYDQWMGDAGDRFNAAFVTLATKIEAVEQALTQSRDQVEAMMRRTQALLDRAAAAAADAEELAAPRLTTTADDALLASTPPPTPAPEPDATPGMYARLLDRLRHDAPEIEGRAAA